MVCLNVFSLINHGQTCVFKLKSNLLLPALLILIAFFFKFKILFGEQMLFHYQMFLCGNFGPFYYPYTYLSHSVCDLALFAGSTFFIKKRDKYLIFCFQ